MAMVKGSHIVVPALYEGEQAYFLQNEDQRVIFVIPYYGFTMIGTTDVHYEGSLDQVEISPEETDYLCSLANQYFNKQLTEKDVINSWSGVRPLIHEGEDKLHEISRDYSLEFCHFPAASVSIYGGKITTYRKLAEQAVNMLTPCFENIPPSQTEKTPLPGADFKPVSIPDYKKQLQQQFPFLEQNLLDDYVDNYGKDCENFLQSVHQSSDLGLHFGHKLYQIEVDYLHAREWAKTAEDILWRRTKQGLRFSIKETQALADYLEKKQLSASSLPA